MNSIHSKAFEYNQLSSPDYLNFPNDFQAIYTLKDTTYHQVPVTTQKLGVQEAKLVLDTTNWHIEFMSILHEPGRHLDFKKNKTKYFGSNHHKYTVRYSITKMRSFGEIRRAPTHHTI
jgi:hypothetical protein